VKLLLAEDLWGPFLGLPPEWKFTKGEWVADELAQVRRAATRTLKLGDDRESLEMKVRFTKAEASAERLWRSRMNDLLLAGLLPTYMI